MYYKMRHYDAIFLVGSSITPSVQLKQFFSIEQRFLQTIETIKSIKKYVPNSLCILLEGSKILPKHRDELVANCDIILEFFDDASVQPYIQLYYNIGIGENRLLQKGIEYLKSNILISSKYLFKISGRYILNDNFNLTNYDETKFNFKKEIHINTIYVTGLFSIPINDIDYYYNILCNFGYNNQPIERYYYENIDKNKVNLQDILGINIRFSYDGSVFNK